MYGTVVDKIGKLVLNALNPNYHQHQRDDVSFCDDVSF